MIIGIIFVIIFLSILVLVHELGHFLAAKKFGLLVEEFGFGLPPRVWGKKIGETIYSINALPFGGFVKILGEDREDEDATQKTRIHPNDPNDPNKTRIIEKELSYTLNGIFFEVHKELDRFSREKQYGDLLEQKLKTRGIKHKREHPIYLDESRTNVVDFLVEDRIIIEIKNKPYIVKDDYFQVMRYLESADLELGMIVNFRSRFLKPKRILNPNVRVDSGHSGEFVNSGRNRSFSGLSISRRVLIIASGVLMNFLLGWLVISIVFSVGLPQAIVITEVFPNSPAEAIGLKAGDIIVGFNNVRVDSGHSGEFVNSGRFIKFTNDNRGKEITLKIERNGEVKELLVTPRVNPPSNEGALGIGLVEAGLEKQSLFSSVWEGLKTSLQIIQMIFLFIFDLIKQLFTTGGVNLAGVAGPVGIVKATAQAESLGFNYLLQLLALISLNLVVINILPFPALDGGRLLFLIIEKIKGSPLPIKFERYANSVGMVLLLILMAAITVRDIVRF